ncbi:MAG: Hsp70 family protein [Planctomycetota bacterium]
MSNASSDRASDAIIGIDLGTTNSVAAWADEAGPRVLHDDLVPSVVRYAVDDAGDAHVEAVGAEAAERAVEFPLTTVSSVKRLMGRSLADVGREASSLGYEVREGAHATVRVALPGARELLSPQEVSAAVLRELKRRASESLGKEVSRAVVTVPAYFDDAQRQATRDAGRLAGLEVVRIVNEPTAAALAYGLGAGDGDGARMVAVYDLGGGTFDVSVLRITPAADGSDGPAFFQVLSTAGDTRLGGDDADQMLVSLFAGEVRAQLGLPESDDTLSGFPPGTRRALRQFAQDVKHQLSAQDSATVRIEVNETTTYERTVTRDELEAMLRPWVDRTIAACERALRDAKVSASDLDAVVLVGGSTRVPLVRARVAEVFGREPYTALDPDRVVALGAAVQAGILAGQKPGGGSALLLDVIPLSLGIETAGGAAAKLIFRNSTVPARATEMFSTSVDGQVSIKLNVVQGEREMAEDCRSLGEFHLQGLPPMPAGVPQLEVAFDVDANGVLSVSAHERRSGKRAQLQVVPNHGLTRDEVDRMEAESLEHARDDMTRHRVVDLITNSKLDLKWIGERLEKFRDELEPSYAAELDAMVEKLRAMVAKAEGDWRSVDANEMHAAKEGLDRASVRLQEVSISASLRED